MIFALFQTFTWIVFFTLGKLFLNLRAKGLENINALKGGGVLFVSNHLSYLDAFLIGASMPRSYYRRIKCFRYATYFKYVTRTLYGPLIWLSGAYPIYPKNGRLEQVLEKSVKYLKDNQDILFFPLGQRSIACNANDARPGVGYLAEETDCPIVPVNIKDTYKIKCIDFFRRKRKVTVTFGKSFHYREVAGENDESSVVAQKIMRRACELD